MLHDVLLFSLFLFNAQFLSTIVNSPEYRLRTLLSRSIYFAFFFLRLCHHWCCCCASENSMPDGNCQSYHTFIVASDECHSMFTQIHHSPHFIHTGEFHRWSWVIPKIVIIETIGKKWGNEPNIIGEIAKHRTEKKTQTSFGHYFPDVWCHLPLENYVKNRTIRFSKDNKIRCLEERFLSTSFSFQSKYDIISPPQYSDWFVSFLWNHFPKKI